MKIEEVNILPYRAQLVRPLFTAKGIVEERLGFLLRLRDSSGAEGWGEAGPIHWMEGNLAECGRALQRLSSLAGRSQEDFRERVTSLTRAYPETACALDTALLDLDARAHGVSLCDLLANGSVGCATPRVSALLTQTTPKRIAAEVTSRAESGYDCVKIKVGSGSMWEDVERLAAVREIFEGEIRIDANGGWSLAQAMTACRNFERYNVAWIEDPLAPPEEGFGQLMNSWRELSEATSIPLALDHRSEDDRTRGFLTGAGAIDWIVLKLARTGGPSRATVIAREMAGTKVRVAFTDSIETGVGQRAALHTAAAQQTPTAVGLGGALTLVELKLDGRAACPAAEALRGPQPELQGPGLG